MSPDIVPLISKALGETVYMVFVAMIIATIIGIPLGVLLHTTAKHQILECMPLNRVLAAVVNAVRSIPFIILMVAIIPFTRFVVNTSIGTTAAMVPLIIASIPFIARQVETSIKEVPEGVVEAAEAMGASPLQIIWHVMLPEARASIAAQSRRSSSPSSANPPWRAQSEAVVSVTWRYATAISASVLMSCSLPSSS